LKDEWFFVFSKPPFSSMITNHHKYRRYK
jgi:hypothetical protein